MVGGDPGEQGAVRGGEAEVDELRAGADEVDREGDEREVRERGAGAEGAGSQTAEEVSLKGGIKLLSSINFI